MRNRISRLFILIIISVCIFQDMTKAQDDDATSENIHFLYLKHRVSDKPIHTISFKLQSSGVDFKNSPAFEGQDIIKGLIIIDERQNTGIPFAWDRLSNKLYIDRNRNFDLTDDPDNVYAGDKRYKVYSYKNLRMDVTRDDVAIPCECTLSLMNLLGKWNADLEINSVWETEAAISGKTWNFTVSDGLDGIAGNSIHDLLLITPKEELPSIQMEASVFPQKLLFLQNKTYKIDCSFIREGDEFQNAECEMRNEKKAKETLLKITLTESDPELGEIRITGKYIKQLVLSGANQVILTSPSQTVSIPAGLYNEQRLLLHGSDPNRTFPISFKKNIYINKTTPYEFKAGGPLKNILDVKRAGNRLLMNYTLVDAENNPIEDALIDTNRVPTIIVYQNGKKIHTDKFQYG